MKLIQILNRANETVLGDMLGRSTQRLIRLAHGRSPSTDELLAALNALYSDEELLLNPLYRGEIVSLLRLTEAKSLAVELGCAAGENAYTSLAQLKVKKNSKLESALLAAFECSRSHDKRLAIPDTVDVPAERALFDHQRSAASRVLDVLRSTDRRVMLHMPTGSGKTRTAMNIVCRHLLTSDPALTIWLATTEELCEQAATEFEAAWRACGNRTVAVHRFWGQHGVLLDSLRDGLLVAGLPKLYSACLKHIPFIAELASKASLVVVDEAHQSVAHTYSLVIEGLLSGQYSTTGLLGLTATPGRTWANVGADLTLSRFFGQNKVTLTVPGYPDVVNYLITEGFLAQPTFRTWQSTCLSALSAEELAEYADGLELPLRLLERLADDEVRSFEIIKHIQGLAQRHRRIIVFATTVRHSALLANVLQSLNLSCRSVTGATASSERERTIRWFKADAEEPRILCNYGVLTAGFDAPQTSAAVIARPTKSLVLYSQMVGRAIRGTRAGGNEEAEILTVVDISLPGFGDLAEAFSNWEDVW